MVSEASAFVQAIKEAAVSCEGRIRIYSHLHGL